MVTDPSENMVRKHGYQSRSETSDTANTAKKPETARKTMSAPAVIVWSAPRLVGKFAGDHFAKAAFGPQPDIGPRGRSDQDMEPAGSTRLLVCIGHGQGANRVTDRVKKIVTSKAPAPAFRQWRGMPEWSSPLAATVRSLFARYRQWSEQRPVYD
jgi:hypothetical protein